MTSTPAPVDAFSRPPREVRIAIMLSWVVVVLEAADRLFRRFVSPDANTFVALGENWSAAIIAFVLLVGTFIFFASRRHNWARFCLLLATLGGWCLWYVWSREVFPYTWWQWLLLGACTAMEIAALVLLFTGKGDAWYREAGRATVQT